jgi:hypothetical protein
MINKRYLKNQLFIVEILMQHFLTLLKLRLYFGGNILCMLSAEDSQLVYGSVLLPVLLT